MCEYCEQKESIHYSEKDYIQELYIEEDKTLTVQGPLDRFDLYADNSVTIIINYCPICGRKLNEEETEPQADN